MKKVLEMAVENQGKQVLYISWVIEDWKCVWVCVWKRGRRQLYKTLISLNLLEVYIELIEAEIVKKY